MNNGVLHVPYRILWVAFHHSNQTIDFQVRVGHDGCCFDNSAEAAKGNLKSRGSKLWEGCLVERGLSAEEFERANSSDIESGMKVKGSIYIEGFHRLCTVIMEDSSSWKEEVGLEVGCLIWVVLSAHVAEGRDLKGDTISHAGGVMVEEDFEVQFIFGYVDASDHAASLGTQTSVEKNSHRSGEQGCGSHVLRLMRVCLC